MSICKQSAACLILMSLSPGAGNGALETDWVNAYAPQVVAAGKPDIDEVIRDVYPVRDELVSVMIGNAAASRDEISKYGTVTGMSIVEPRFHT